MKGTEESQVTGLIADPIYHYIVMTDRVEGERTERDVIDTPWVQRLRRIFQLQKKLFSGQLDLVAGEIAYHFEKCRDLEPSYALSAIMYLLRAGDRARVLFAFQDAIGYYQRALVILEERHDYELIARAKLKLGLTFHSMFAFSEAHAAYEESFAATRLAITKKMNTLPSAPHALRVVLTPRTLDSSLSLDPINMGDDYGEAIVADLLFSRLVELTPDLDVLPGVFPDPGDLAVGDWLLMPVAGVRPVRMLTRQTKLARKESGHGTDEQLIAANVDTLFIVTSCNEDFNLARIERYLALASGAGVTPVIILTKADLVDDVAPFKTATRQLHPEVAIECIDARNAVQLARLRPWCTTGKTVALVGSSGVGKSTLINNLAEAQQVTAAARAGDNKGRHTTTSRSLHPLKDGGMLVDTPGMREFQLAAGAQNIEDAFAEVSALLGHCKFNDCRHQGEAGCAIQAAIASGALDARRWQSYLTLRAEQRSSPSPAARASAARSAGPRPKPVRKGPRPPRLTDED